MSTRQFLQGCVYSMITPELEEVLFEKLNVNNKKELWLVLNEFGYFINHYQDADGKYMHEIVPMSKKAKRKYAELKKQTENELGFGTNLKCFGGR